MGYGKRSIQRWTAHGGLLRVIVAFWVILSAGQAQAQAVKGQIVSVGIGGNAGQNGIYREGSWIPVQVRLRNMTGQPFVGHLAIDQDLIDLDGDKVMAIGPEFTLNAGVEERTLWTYYWPRPDYTNSSGGITKVVVLDSTGNVSPNSAMGLSPNTPGAVSITPTDSFTAHRSTRLVLVLGKNFSGWRSFEGMVGGTEAVLPVQINAHQLPDRVLGYDGVDVMVWQADAVTLSDLAPPELTLKPILEWVKAGGHLIISVGAKQQMFAGADTGEELKAALPLKFTGTREAALAEIGKLGLWGAALSAPAAPKSTLIQSVGELKAGTRTVIGEPPAAEGAATAPLAEHPLVVTGLYGRGAITVITVDIANPEMQRLLSERDWITFWNQAAGWRQNTTFYTAGEYKKYSSGEQEEKVSYSPAIIHLGEKLEQEVDVTEQTVVRIFVALLFLAAYWLIAGPVGHLVLRRFKVVHWSWWIFGGVVVAATAVAGVVVLVMHVKSYDVRHRSFVLGTVNSPEATVNSFYGIYAPVSGQIPIQQPEGAGLNYIVPLCLPSPKDVQSYADPQSYELHTEQTAGISPVFRNTLKKLQARWTGALPGIAGTAEYLPENSKARHLITGTLTNNSGYELRDADILVYLPPVTRGLEMEARNSGTTYLYHVMTSNRIWRQGETIDLPGKLALDDLGMPTNGVQAKPGTVEMAVRAIGWKKAPAGGSHRGNNDLMSKDEQLKALESMVWRDDLLYVLGDARNNDELYANDRRELARGVGRLTDCTKALHAAGALIVAHAEDVKSPVTLKVNGNAVAGKGNVVFAWALPLGGTPPQKPMSIPLAPTNVSGGPRRTTLIPEAP